MATRADYYNAHPAVRAIYNQIAVGVREYWEQGWSPLEASVDIWEHNPMYHQVMTQNYLVDFVRVLYSYLSNNKENLRPRFHNNI